jgi:hypothetical protein
VKYFPREITSSSQVSPPEIIERLGIDTESECGRCALGETGVAQAAEGEQYWLKYWKTKN